MMLARLITSAWRRIRRKVGVTASITVGFLILLAFMDWANDGNYEVQIGPISFRRGGRSPTMQHRGGQADETDLSNAHDDDGMVKVGDDSTNFDETTLAGIEIYSGTSCTGEVIRVNALESAHKCVRCFDTCRQQFDSGKTTLNEIKSFKVTFGRVGRGGGRMPNGWSVSTYGVCGGSYGYSESALENAKINEKVRPEDGCIDTVDGKYPNLLRFEGMVHPDDVYTPQSYHVVYSCESSGYFGFQAYANLWAFQNSGQQANPPTGYTRLLTASEDDDLAKSKGGIVPTFSAPRNPISHTYSPYNKPHVLSAFMNSPDRSPKEEVIVVIDPDNWLFANLGPIAAKVKRGHGVAAAAFYDGNPLVTDLWQNHICKVSGKSCDFIPDTVAVPYFVHRDDAKNIAPLWFEMTKSVKEVFRKPELARKYNSLQPGWCAEMYGYVYAAAELRVKHSILPNLQIRDVDGTISVNEAVSRRVRMIHMGRAWFPEQHAHENTPQWIHTEGRDLRKPNTEQVWCKCNATAADVRPWPLPQGIDFVSNYTLTALHESEVEFGNPEVGPHNKYRRSYHQNFE